MTNFMLDIETVGNKNDAAIMEISCVAFDLVTGYPIKVFTISVNPFNHVENGGTVNLDTIVWWVKKDHNKFLSKVHGGSEIGQALAHMSRFINEVEPDISKRIMWAKSPSFDCVIINSALDRFGMDKLWNFWNERDVRTVFSMFPKIVENHKFIGDQHDSESDAMNQIMVISKCLRGI